MEDRLSVIKHSALKGYQSLSLAAPLALVALAALKRSPLTVSRLLRTTYLSNSTGAALGAAAAYARLRDASPESIQDRRLRLEYNASQRRTDDYSIIGSVLGAILTPFVFLRKASVPTLVLGGAGLGSAAGVLTHLAQSFTENKNLTPSAMRDV